MSELDALLLRLKTSDPVPPAGFEEGVLLAIGKIRAERRLSRVLIPWETMIVVGALALGVWVGVLSQAARWSPAADPTSPWIAPAPSTLLLGRAQ